MDTVNMLINVAAILAGLFLFIGISNTKWGKEHSEYPYAMMLVSILFAVLLGGLIRWLVN